MAELRFRMDLKESSTLLMGTLELIKPDGNRHFVATSGLTGCQAPRCQSWRGRGPIPAVRNVGLPHYTVSTKPFDERNVVGVEGNFYYIEPATVLIDGVWRSEFGIHRDANAPGSAGCIVLRQAAEWTAFQEHMRDLKRAGHDIVPLHVEYNGAVTRPRVASYLTVAAPKEGAVLDTGKSLAFSGTAKPEVARIVVTIGPGRPHLIGDVKPAADGKWRFTQTLVTPGVRPLKFRALDDADGLLQDVDLTVTLQ